MDRLIENTGCYAKEEQRSILLQLFKHEAVKENFQNPYTFPDILADFDIDEFYRFYEDLIYKTYHRKEE